MQSERSQSTEAGHQWLQLGVILQDTSDSKEVSGSQEMGTDPSASSLWDSKTLHDCIIAHFNFVTCLTLQVPKARGSPFKEGSVLSFKL